MDVFPPHAESTDFRNTEKYQRNTKNCGQSPIYFEQISSTDRTQCHVYSKSFISDSRQISACSLQWVDLIHQNIFMQSAVAAAVGWWWH